MKTILVVICLVFATLINTSIITPAPGINAHNNDSVLLVRIINLKADQRGRQNTITWTSISEIDIDCYEIQRSSNGTDFTTIGVTSATGNGKQGAHYSYNDLNTLMGNNFYRLKVYNRNGKTAFSNTIQVKDSSLTMVYPVPARDILYIQTNSNTQFFIIDGSGRVLLSANINGKGSINVSRLPVGVYFLRNNNTGNIQRIVIAR